MTCPSTVTETIRISISAADGGTDAPTVDDLLGQLGDYFAVYEGVEAAITRGEDRHVVWRVTNASRNSPLQVTVTAYPAAPGIAFEQVASEAKRATANGLRDLIAGTSRPPFYTDNVLEAAHRFAGRVTGGLARVAVDHGDGEPEIVFTPLVARSTVEHIQVALEPPPRAGYRELGTLEGTIKAVERDGFGHPLIRLRHRLTGVEIKCWLEGEALELVQRRTVGEVVFRGRRAELVGQINYRSPGRVSSATIHTIRFAPAEDDLPSLAGVIDVDFTGGLRSEAYLERLRSGGRR